MFVRKCPKCKSEIAHRTEKTGKRQEKEKRLCRKCSSKTRSPNPNTNCAVCKKEIYRIPKRKKENNFCCYSCRNKFYSKEKSFAWKGGQEESNKKRRNRAWDKKDRQEKKRKAVSFLGGKCLLCGYDKCIAAMDFHHKIPEEKDFNIKNIISCSWKKIEEELKKCILLCANCHREEHWRKANE